MMSGERTTESDGLEKRLASAAREPAPGLSQAEMTALWGRVRAEATAPPGWLERLRELPTGVRVTMALGFALVVVAIALLATGTRESLAGPGMMRLTLGLSGLALLAAASFAVSLRGMHQRPLRGAGWGVIAMAVAVPVSLALLPQAPHADGRSGLGCLLFGVATGALVSVPAFLMQRASVPVLARACAALAAGGAFGYALLELHCPSRDVTHLLVGHAAVGVVLVVLSAIVVSVRRR